MHMLLYQTLAFTIHSRVLYTFVPNKSFGQLLDISSKRFTFFKTFDLEILKVNVTLAINQNVKYKINSST